MSSYPLSSKALLQKGRVSAHGLHGLGVAGLQLGLLQLLDLFLRGLKQNLINNGPLDLNCASRARTESDKSCRRILAKRASHYLDKLLHFDLFGARPPLLRLIFCAVRHLYGLSLRLSRSGTFRRAEMQTPWEKWGKTKRSLTSSCKLNRLLALLFAVLLLVSATRQLSTTWIHIKLSAKIACKADESKFLNELI